MRYAWKRGVTEAMNLVGDLYDSNDPFAVAVAAHHRRLAGFAFLASIMSGTIPTELVREARGGEVHVNMEDHKTEEFVKPKVGACKQKAPR